jgi:hypothetical protein
VCDDLRRVQPVRQFQQHFWDRALVGFARDAGSILGGDHRELLRATVHPFSPIVSILHAELEIPPEELRRLAMSPDMFTAEMFFLPEGEVWKAPAGAYKRCGGPT